MSIEVIKIFFFFFDDITFADRLKELRTSNHLTLEQLGKEIEVTKATLANFENGNRKPSLDMLIKIGNYFEVSLDYLAGRSDTTTFTPRNPKKSN